MSSARPLDDYRPWPATPWATLAALTAPDRRCILLLVSRNRWTAELAADNPLLFFLLARLIRRHRLRQTQAATLAGLRRTRLLGILGLDDAAATERFLRRCGFLRLDEPEIDTLRRLTRQALPAWVHHWRVPHLALLTRVPHDEWEAGARALDNLLAHDPTLRAAGGTAFTPQDFRGRLPTPVEGAIASIAEVTRLIPLEARAPMRDVARHRLARCRTLAEVDDLHLFLADRDRHYWTSAVRSQIGSARLPPPPVPGSDNVVPLSSAALLIDEGCTMHHCIASYARAVARGECYAYRVLAPERATLMLRRRNTTAGNSLWELEEVRLAGNRVPSDATFEAIERWLPGGAQLCAGGAQTTPDTLPAR